MPSGAGDAYATAASRLHHTKVKQGYPHNWNGYGKHTGDLQMFRAGQGKTAGSEVVWGSGATVSSVGAVLSQEGAVRLYEIVTPRKNTLQGNSNRALKP